jgi:predicted nucleic acid-binding protein
MRRRRGEFYVDTSALTKFYLKEAGSRRMTTWFGHPSQGLDPAVRLYVSALAYPEAISAVKRRSNKGELAPGVATELWNRIMAHFYPPGSPYNILKVNEAVVGRAALLIARSGLRAYDAVQLASALDLQFRMHGRASVTFVTSDARLRGAAQAERLETADPTD